MKSVNVTDQRILHWRGPDPPRVDAVAVRLGADALAAHGTSLTGSWALDFRLATGPGWVTRELDVRVRGDGWWRSLVLRRAGDGDGDWSADWDGAGAGDLPGPLPDLRGALDCDLALCPLTNTMPIRRHDLVGAANRGAAGSHDLVMAWVSVPDLAVHPSEQCYIASDPVDEGGALVVFASEGFRTTIEVDADGLVANYPGIARRVEP